MKDIINNLLYEISNELNNSLKHKDNNAEFFKTVSYLYEKFEGLYEYLEDFSDVFELSEEFMLDFNDLLINEVSYENAQRYYELMKNILNSYDCIAKDVRYHHVFHEGQSIKIGKKEGLLKPGDYDALPNNSALIKITSNDRQTVVYALDNATVIELHYGDRIEIVRGEITIRPI